MERELTPESFVTRVYHVKRGKAIIFNHENYSHPLIPTRAGTDKDKEKLKLTLEKFNFRVEIKEDQSVEKIKKYLDAFSAQNHENIDAILVAVLTHGDEEGLYDRDGEVYDPQETLCQPFSQENKTLAGKPKIFLISACRGHKADYGQVMEAPGGARPSLTRRKTPVYVKIPSESEFLVFKSTPQGYVSWRNPGIGTRFIQVLCQVLDFEAGEEAPRDLLTLFTLVNRLVSELEMRRGCEGISFKQIPEIQSTLTNLVFLTPLNQQPDHCL